MYFNEAAAEASRSRSWPLTSPTRTDRDSAAHCFADDYSAGNLRRVDLRADPALPSPSDPKQPQASNHSQRAVTHCDG